MMGGRTCRPSLSAPHRVITPAHDVGGRAPHASGIKWRPLARLPMVPSLMFGHLARLGTNHTGNPYTICHSDSPITDMASICTPIPSFLSPSHPVFPSFLSHTHGNPILLSFIPLSLFTIPTPLLTLIPSSFLSPLPLLGPARRPRLPVTMGALVNSAAVPAVYWGAVSASTPGETLWTQTYIVLQHTMIIYQCTSFTWHRTPDDWFQAKKRVEFRSIDALIYYTMYMCCCYCIIN
ncbi:hypothetical protein AB205_0168960, partial [Aquarana catesbeiana]